MQKVLMTKKMFTRRHNLYNSLTKFVFCWECFKEVDSKGSDDGV